MLLLNDKVQSLPVVSLQTGRKLADITQPVVDPRQLQVLAYFCEGPNVDIHPAVLHTDDIREVSSLGLIIDSAENIMSPQDLIRLQEVLSYKFNLIGMKVVDEAGNKLGKVQNFSIETNTFFIIKLHVQPNWLNALHTAENIIDRSQVVEINDKGIIVKSTKSSQKSQAHPIIDNPFRSARPQPDAAHHLQK